MNLKLRCLLKNLSSGYSFRGKVKHFRNGNIRVIQLKDFENNYMNLGCNFTLINSDIKNKYYLDNEDVLFISKGANNFAMKFTKIDDKPTIASSALYRLEVDKNKVIPEYLAWYINQKKAQSYLKTHAEGTYSISVNRATLMEMPIELPSLEIQKNIVSMVTLHEEELALTNEIIALKNKLRTEQFLKIIKNGN